MHLSIFSISDKNMAHYEFISHHVSLLSVPIHIHHYSANNNKPAFSVISYTNQMQKMYTANVNML